MVSEPIMRMPDVTRMAAVSAVLRITVSDADGHILQFVQQLFKRGSGARPVSVSQWPNKLAIVRPFH